MSDHFCTDPNRKGVDYAMNKPTREQQQIIEATEGYVRCGAVPGSGKTYCITGRMAYLITELYVDPSSIVALTFTNKAAAGMTHRLKKMIGDEAACFTGTFHGYCNKILKEEIYRLSYPRAFTIADVRGQTDIIREIAEELHLSLKDFTARAYLEEIAERKLAGGYIAYLAGPDKTKLQEKIASAQDDIEKVYYNFLMKQRDNYVLDFNDIIEFTIHILQTYPDALAKWQDKCMYILCDEYQDVNARQELLLSLLSGKYQNLTVVGDDDQCIYGWRGSRVEYIVDFDSRYPGAKSFYLTENFRSTPEIVAVANSLITANQNRLAKQMVSNRPSGRKPVYNNLMTEKDEAAWIADTIRMAVDQGKKYSDHTVLVRSSSQTRALEEAFMKKKAPYKILSGAEFYGSEEIKTVLAYLRMVYAMNDLDFTYTIQRPRRGYGRKSVEKLKEYAVQRNLTLMEALGEQIQGGMESRQQVIDYYNNIAGLHHTYGDYSCKELVNLVLDFGYRKCLQQDVDQTKLDNVSELLVTVAALEEENQEIIPLEELLAYFALFTSQDDDTDHDRVRIMTIHTAKGLEFDTVFVNGLVEGQFPSKRLVNEDELEEERRLLYVAVTRAKEMLYLSGYEVKAGSFTARQSSFLGDIDVDLLDCIDNSKIEKGYATPAMRPKARLAVGDEVLHKGFGEGIVTGVDEKTQTYEIKFQAIGQPRRIQFRAGLIKL